MKIEHNKTRVFIPSTTGKPLSASSETLAQFDAEGSNVYLPIAGLSESAKEAILLQKPTNSASLSRECAGNVMSVAQTKSENWVEHNITSSRLSLVSKWRHLQGKYACVFLCYYNLLCKILHLQKGNSHRTMKLSR